jgi:hypothetical protein
MPSRAAGTWHRHSPLAIPGEARPQGPEPTLCRRKAAVSEGEDNGPRRRAEHFRWLCAIRSPWEKARIRVQNSAWDPS